MGDDGLGIRVVEELKRRRLPKNVTVMDGGTGSFDLVNYFFFYDVVVIVDAVNFGGKPGRVYRLPVERVLKRKIASIHDLDIFYAISAMSAIQAMPRVILIGAEVKNLAEFSEMSSEAEEAVKKVVKRIVKLVTPSSGRRARIRRTRVQRLKPAPT
ncbi:hydrogenase maturation protease [Archaeoglobus fulgidus]|jgi:hydrogenase maturation protease|nr:hydrogenase maturation protease [Archaeoglobus fulgidus]AIG98257.1 hydrogenase maturation protease [Archaeoglobus fulgidus DSM 8774]KUJ93186.1 MAG: F420-nonreducing hydrogenase (VhtD-2) [Archaeoglobus fulgidus]KUK05721.1 MAG: F420-nonreducing hydrogenase (VhtD-2) [Archaeoglobus fulgidus]